jgi:phage tail protein X
MGFVERMKWWHWTALSLVLGALLAYLNSGGADTSVSHGSVSPVVFETGLISKPWVDPNNASHRVPFMSDFVVHPVEALLSNGQRINRQLVSYSAFMAPNPGHPSGTTSTEYYWAIIPYEPTPRWNRDNRQHSSYPAASAYIGKKGDTLGDLAARFYKKDTIAGVRAIINANPSLRDAKGPDDIKIKAGRAYWIPWNPADGHTVSDFLVATDNFNKQQQGASAIPISFHYCWWESSKYGGEIWMIGTFLLVGVIWPALLGVMIRGGLGSMTPEEYDLSRFKGGRDPATMPKPSTAAVTQSDMDRLRELEESMAANLNAGATAAPASTEEKPEQAAPAVAKLTGKPTDASIVPSPKEEPKEYGGEFYPVVKPHGKPDEKKH